MDPTWEVDYVLNIANETTAKCSASFFMGDTPDKMQQIGDTQTYSVRKGIVPGEEVNMEHLLGSLNPYTC